MKRRAKWLVGIVLFYLLFVFVGNQLFYGKLAVLVWHWRHGNSTQMVGYEIPVPGQWFVASANPTSVELVRVQNQGLWRATFASRATASVQPKPLVELNYWKGLQETFLRNEGATTLRSREIQLGSHDRVVCLEGEFVREILKVKGSKLAELVSVECQSDGRLSLMFTGQPEDTQEFYGIVASIQPLP